MTAFRKPFGIFMCLCYLWAFAIPYALACPCEEHIPGEAKAESSKESTCCRPPDTPHPCCTMVEPEPVQAAPESSQGSGCCFGFEQCNHCPLCQSATLYLPLDQQISPKQELEANLLPGFIIESSVSALFSIKIDHPPNRVNLAPHIPTTVLLC